MSAWRCCSRATCAIRSRAELLLLSKILLIAGGVLILASVVLGFGGILRFFSKRSSQLGTNTTVLTLGVIVILVIVNYLGYQPSQALRPDHREAISPCRTKRKRSSSGLKNDVNIVRFSKTPDPQFDDLMAEYKTSEPPCEIPERRPAGKAGGGQGVWRARTWAT